MHKCRLLLRIVTNQFKKYVIKRSGKRWCHCETYDGYVYDSPNIR